MDGYDLTIYQEIATRALNNSQPYSHPYADFPPLKLGIFALIQLGGLVGWFWFMIGLYIIFSITVYFFIRTFFINSLTNFLCGLCLIFLPDVFAQYWLQTYEDKVIYVVMILMLLIFMFRRKLIFSSFVLGFLQAYGGVGIVLLPVVGLWWYYHLNRSKKEFFQILVPFLVIILTSHLYYFPDWINGYKLRTARTTIIIPAHTSIFQIPYRLWGLYNSLLPNLLTICGILTIYLYIFWNRLKLPVFYYSIFLLNFCWFAFGPEAGYDRILAAFLPIVLIILDQRIYFFLIFSLFVLSGLLLPVYPADPLSIGFLWLIPGIAIIGLVLTAQQKINAPIKN